MTTALANNTNSSATGINRASNSSTSTSSDTSDSSGISGDAPSSASPPDSPGDDSIVYSNKQLIAHLLKVVCSNGGSRPNETNNNISSNNYGAYSARNRPVNTGASLTLQQDSRASSRSRSPSDGVPTVHADDSSVQQPQPPYQMLHQHQHSQASGSSSDHLTASSAGLSNSGAYISPFAQSPISEASPWYQPAISRDVITDPRTHELERILLRLCDEFEQRLHDRFDDFGARLDTQPATIRDSVTREMDTLFYDDNIHWGRIIAVFVLCREICDKCSAEGRREMTPAVQQWVAEFIDSRLWDWMRRNCGWYGLVKFYRETGGDRSAAAAAFGVSAWHPVASLLTISAVSIGIALAAAYFRR